MSVANALRGMAAAVALVAAPAAPQPAASDATRSLIALEQVDQAWQGMPTLVDALDRYRVAIDGAPALGQADALRSAVRQAFVEDIAARIAAQIAATSTSSDPAVESAFMAASAGFLAARAKLAPVEKADYATFERRTRARFDARRDKLSLDRLADAMAHPALAAEVALTGQRLTQLLEATKGGMPADLAQADRAALARGIGELLVATRRDRDKETGLFNAVLLTGAAKGRIRLVLLDLAPADVAALLAFYHSPGGRTRRNALVNAFARENDAAGRQLATTYIIAARALEAARRR